MMEREDVDVLMVKYLENRSSTEDLTRLFNWVAESPENKTEFFEIKELWDAKKRIASMDKLPSKDDWNALNEKMQFLQKKSTSKINLRGASRKSLQMPKWPRYAAVLILLIGMAAIWHLRQKSIREIAGAITVVEKITIHNTRGVYKVTLPDSSRVWLHGATSLTYPQQFAESGREVNLQGEAYFEVISDPVNSFTVHTSLTSIRAVGTEFNITAYPRDEVVTTTLVKGTVDLLVNNPIQQVRLAINQQALVFIDNPDIKIQDIDAGLFVDWKDGVYRFKNEP